MDEIQGSLRKKWIFPYKTLKIIKDIIDNSLLKFDNSILIWDVTIQDGSLIQVNEKFEKIWEINNN
jgi:hypothetical protein